VTRRGHEAGVHRIQAIFTIGYPAAVWDVTASDNGEFIAAAVDPGWEIPRGSVDLQKKITG
jgi:hypothetical protein